MKRWMIIVLGVVVVLAIGFFVVLYFVRSTSEWAKTLTWDEPNLAAVADGEYEGSANLKMAPGTAAANTTATVRLTVKHHRYTAIEVLGPAQIAPNMTRYAQIVVERQSVRPDAISGATITKSVVLMAAANALAGK